MAEAYFNMLAGKHGSRWHAASAGVCAADGMRASANAVALMQEFSAHLDDFRSRSVSVGMLQDSALIICMEAQHCRAITNFYPRAAEKTKLLANWLKEGNRESDISWLSEDFDFYRSCFNTMKTALDNLFEYVNQN